MFNYINLTESVQELKTEIFKIFQKNIFSQKIARIDKTCYTKTQITR